MRGITVQRDATVLIQDFGEETVKAPSIEAAVDMQIARGWEREEERAQIIEDLRKEYQQEMARGENPTRD